MSSGAMISVSNLSKVVETSKNVLRESGNDSSFNFTSILKSGRTKSFNLTTREWYLVPTQKPYVFEIV